MRSCYQSSFAVDRDGLTLRGTIYLPAAASGPAATVLLMHGFTGNRIETGFLFVQLARALAANGIAAVTFDFLHSGESDGSFDEMLVSGQLADALFMTRWLKDQAFCDRDRMGLLGFSLGGLVAASATGETADYRALVLIAPTTVVNVQRFAQDAEHNGRIIKGPFTLHRRFFDDLATLDPLGACVRHPRPTLVIEAEKDEVVPFFVSREYIKAMRQKDTPREVEKVEGAGHLFDTPKTRARLIELVRGFCSRELRC
jgi:hypothetical protein